MVKKSILIGLLLFTAIIICGINFHFHHFGLNFIVGCTVFLLTAIFSSIIFFVTKNFSIHIALYGVILFLFFYLVFSASLLKNSMLCMSIAFILTQAATILFTLKSAVIVKSKTTEKIKKGISKYMSARIFEDIEKNIVQTTSGKKENLTVMFIDIRGFTRISEMHSAEEVSTILNNYFQEVIPVIKRHNGTVNKFIGDALLAVFTGDAPEIHARNAVIAGRDILKKLKNAGITQEAEGRDKITVGIGINTGEVFVGSIGTEDRCEYAVIGDTVNIASRVESVNRVYKTDFLITENTYPYVKDIADVIKISDVEFKGKREKINVYEVLRIVERD